MIPLSHLLFLAINFSKGSLNYHFKDSHTGILWDRNHQTDDHGASLVAQTVKNLPATEDTWVRSLGWEDPLKKGMATHSSILAWSIP